MGIGSTASEVRIFFLRAPFGDRRRTRLLLVSAALVLFAAVLPGCSSSPAVAIDPPSGWPIPSDKATVTSNFGAPRRGYSHQGIDLAAPSGTKVRSTADGRVTFAGKSGEFGRLVVIDHGGGWETRYAHLKKINVAKGNRVGRGDVIGSVGHSGNANGDHLHYEVRYDNRPVDPRQTLRR